MKSQTVTIDVNLLHVLATTAKLELERVREDAIENPGDIDAQDYWQALRSDLSAAARLLPEGYIPENWQSEGWVLAIDG